MWYVESNNYAKKMTIKYIKCIYIYVYTVNVYTSKACFSLGFFESQKFLLAVLSLEGTSKYKSTWIMSTHVWGNLQSSALAKTSTLAKNVAIASNVNQKKRRSITRASSRHSSGGCCCCCSSISGRRVSILVSLFPWLLLDKWCSSQLICRSSLASLS